MPATPRPSGETPPDPAIERLADLDEAITGAGRRPSSGPRAEGGTRGDDRVRPDQVDLLLRLHQLGAAWRERTGQGESAPPARIDRFEIVREVGQGGFATVYEARDTLLGRRVALKVAHPDSLVSPRLRRRFLRAAELAARLSHPNLATIHDLGESDGVVFIAEEFCSGGTLAEWLDRHPGPVDPRLAALIVRDLAAALDVAHGAGVVHRDIKPDNILLAPSKPGAIPRDERTAAGNPGFDVKLCDFGLGKRDDDGPSPLTRVTRAGAILGTPAWMAPEQVDHAIGEVGPATDVHALGLVLDRLLTGRCRWSGRTDSETLRLILLREPSAVDRSIPGVPRDLSAVCRRCLARNPGERYTRAGDLAADLARFLLGVPTEARPLSAWERACRGAARRPVAVATGAALFVAAAITGFALWGWSDQASAASRQRDSLRRIDAALELQRGLADLAAGNSAAARARIAAVASLDPALDRSFAGRWARRRLRGERQILLGSDDPGGSPVGRPPDLYCCAVSPEGGRVAVGAADGRLILLEAEGNAAATVIVDAHDEINDVAFSADGRLVASAGEDGRVRLFAADTGALVRDVAAEPQPLYAVAFSADGTHLAWAGSERVLGVGGTEAATISRLPVPLAVADGSDGPDIEAVVFVDDDTVAVAGGREVMLVSVEDGAVIRRFEGHEGSVGNIDLSPDRTRMVTAGTDRIPRIWDLGTGGLIVGLPLHPQWVQGCAFTADGRRVVTGCRDGVLQVFDAATGKLLERLPGHVGRTWDVRREPGGTVLSTGADGTLRRWTTDRSHGLAGGHEWPVAVAPLLNAFPVVGIDETDTMVLLVAGIPAGVLGIDPATGRTRFASTLASPKGFSDFAVDAARDRFGIVHSSGPVDALPIAGAAIAATSLEGRHQRIAWTPMGQLVTASEGMKSVVRGFDAKLAEGTDIDRFDSFCDAVAVAPDGGTLAAAGTSSLHLIPIARSGVPRPTGPVRAITLDASFGNVRRIAWAPDGRRLAVGSASGNVRILDARDGATIHVLSGHRGMVTSLAWSADGTVLFSADGDVLRVTDSVTAVCVDSFAPGWEIRSVVLSGPPDAPDRWLVIGGDSTEELPATDGTPARGRVLVVEPGG